MCSVITSEFTNTLSIDIQVSCRLLAIWFVVVYFYIFNAIDMASVNDSLHETLNNCFQSDWIELLFDIVDEMKWTIQLVENWKLMPFGPQIGQVSYVLSKFNGKRKAILSKVDRKFRPDLISPNSIDRRFDFLIWNEMKSSQIWPKLHTPQKQMELKLEYPLN